MRMLLFLTCVSVFILSHHVAMAANITRYEDELMKVLFKDYNKETRPVLNQSQAVSAKFGIALKEVLDMDERNQILTTNVWVRQTWTDAWLKWDPAKHGGITAINVDPSFLWKPDMVLYNNVNDEDRGEQYLFNTKVIIYSTGDIEWYSPNILKTHCKIDIQYFPFDTQTCKLTFGSWTYNGLKIDVTFFRGIAGADISTYSHNGEWELVSADAVRNVVKYSCCPEPYQDLTYKIKIKRRSMFYVNNLILPCILLALLTGLSFLFPPETGERISLVVTVLLGMTVFMIIFTEAIPATSEATPLIGKYFAAVLIEISLCLLATCVPLRLHHHHPGTEVPPWAKFIIFDIIGTLCCYKCGRKKQKTNVNFIELETEKHKKGNGEATVIENGFLEDFSGENVRARNPRMQFSPSLDRAEDNSLAVMTRHYEKVHHEERCKAEWKDAIVILDRLFFWLFVLTFCISSFAILLAPTS
ncbi:neuronal acetylcholine receptor subunit alpha-10 isoform X2 [Nematostella vectensis]|uniref:neuronal acetylcholine receptor subunit alpha-10 isoform X2 n=1 Tax=Nematostella vectensis TaxID=45351 RepID=UPI00138FD13E|nr:neuronal acetylcholine receptor subunit alpha-10 isoform X2 [Nematostella vectensis]